MMQKTNWYNWFLVMFKEFLTETVNKAQYEIVDIYECNKTGFKKAIVKISERHTIEKNISEIIVDNDFIECLDKKTIRTLTYMATAENLTPDYSIVVQEMGNEVDDYLLELKSKNGRKILKKSPSELSRDKNLIGKLSPIEANRVGYLAGVRETVRDYEVFSKNKEI